MNKCLFSIMPALSLTIGTVAKAAPTTTYDWSETGSSYGNGSGTLTVDTTSDLGPDSNYYNFNGNGYDYTILSLTGTFAGSPVSLAYGPGYQSQLCFSSATLPAATLLDETIEFLANGQGYSLFNSTLDVPGSPCTIFKYNFATTDAGTDAFTMTPAPVPEPGSLALASLGGLALLGWRKRTTRHAPSHPD